MKKWFVTTVAVWVVAATSAVLLVYKIHRPLEYVPPAGANAMSLFAGHPTQEVDEPALDEEPPVLELPPVTIVGSLRGSAEMQGGDDVVIGPGVVTHLP